jgi:hypothetical protein
MIRSVHLREEGHIGKKGNPLRRIKDTRRDMA